MWSKRLTGGARDLLVKSRKRLMMKTDTSRERQWLTGEERLIGEVKNWWSEWETERGLPVRRDLLVRRDFVIERHDKHRYIHVERKAYQ